MCVCTVCVCVLCVHIYACRRVHCVCVCSVYTCVYTMCAHMCVQCVYMCACPVHVCARVCMYMCARTIYVNHVCTYMYVCARCTWICTVCTLVHCCIYVYTMYVHVCMCVYCVCVYVLCVYICTCVHACVGLLGTPGASCAHWLTVLWCHRLLPLRQHRLCPVPGFPAAWHTVGIYKSPCTSILGTTSAQGLGHCIRDPELCLCAQQCLRREAPGCLMGEWPIRATPVGGTAQQIWACTVASQRGEASLEAASGWEKESTWGMK